MAESVLRQTQTLPLCDAAPRGGGALSYAAPGLAGAPSPLFLLHHIYLHIDVTK